MTSPTAGDGKSTVAANLALAFAQAGRRTVLVDADLRKPTIHELFDLSNTFGLTSLIRSEVIDLGQVIRTVDEPNLRVLTSGPLPPNPAELLGSNRMRTIIEALKADADLVVFDTPPSAAVTDAAVLASLIDGTIVVVAARPRAASTCGRRREPDPRRRPRHRRRLQPPARPGQRGHLRRVRPRTGRAGGERRRPRPRLEDGALRLRPRAGRPTRDHPRPARSPAAPAGRARRRGPSAGSPAAPC